MTFEEGNIAKFIVEPCSTFAIHDTQGLYRCTSKYATKGDAYLCKRVRYPAKFAKH